MADSILFWNAVALEANRVSHSDPAKGEQQGPTLSSRALAIVHLAMYDAYAGIKSDTANFPRYLPETMQGDPCHPRPDPSGTSGTPLELQEAVAGAAYTSLVKLYPAQKDYFDTQIEFFQPAPPNPINAFQFGIDVANNLWCYRKDDPGAGDCGYKASPDRFRHRVDPDNPMQGFHGPNYGTATGFSIAVRHHLDEPPRGDNPIPNVVKDYIKALRQVRTKGIKPELTATLPDKLTSPNFKPFENRRTAEETLIGIYWGYDGSNRLGTPPRFFNLIAREVAMKQGNGEGTNARLFAFLNAALGDAGILAWEQKYCHDLWRPVVGIREDDVSFGPKLGNLAKQNISQDADPEWLPLGAPSTNSSKKNFSPNFPAYPSGHATFGAAALHIMRLFYGQGTTGSGANKKPYDSNGKIIKDNLLNGIGIISEEFNGMNQDNRGTVRPRHVRKFKNGLADMIIENGLSRVYLGVHWFFDAFALKNEDEDLRKNIGGVPLGLNIAKDIFDGGNGIAPKYNATTPTNQDCISKEDDGTIAAQRDFRGLSSR